MGGSASKVPPRDGADAKLRQHGVGLPSSVKPQTQVQSQQKGPEADYFGYEALLKSVESGAIGAVRGSFVIELERQGGIIARRQDLPASAFWTFEELRDIAKLISSHFGDNSSELGLLFVALSYRWLTGPHPDPDGFHLKHVARIARGDEGGKGYLDHVREMVFSKIGLAHLADFALFW